MQLWKSSAKPEPAEKQIHLDEQAETIALVQVTDKARRVLEEFGFPPADFGLEATAETLGQDDTLVPTSKWKIFNPKAENKRIYDMDRDEYPEATMILPTQQTPLTEYRARDSKGQTIAYTDKIPPKFKFTAPPNVTEATLTFDCNLGKVE